MEQVYRTNLWIRLQFQDQIIARYRSQQQRISQVSNIVLELTKNYKQEKKNAYKCIPPKQGKTGQGNQRQH